MSEAEIVGLVLTAAMLSAVVGVGLTLALHRRDASAWSRRVRQTDAYADWLAARFSLTRASLDYISALRALKAAVRDAGAVPLRRDEAHRARAAFHEATVRLDRGVATLVAWSDERDVFGRVRELDRLTAECLRGAIDGDEAVLDGLARRIDEADRRAVELVRRSAARSRRSGSAAVHGVIRLRRLLASITDHWGE